MTMTIALATPTPGYRAEVAAELLAQPIFAGRKKAIRAHRPVPLFRLDPQKLPVGDGPLEEDATIAIGWRYLLRIGKGLMSADFSDPPDGSPARLIALYRDASTERWLEAMRAVAQADFGRADSGREEGGVTIGLIGLTRHNFDHVLFRPEQVPPWIGRPNADGGIDDVTGAFLAEARRHLETLPDLEEMVG